MPVVLQCLGDVAGADPHDACLVGGYCVFEENACQWGLMAPDGKVVVEARYQKVEQSE